MNCFLCYDNGEIYFSQEEDFDLEYCFCEAGSKKYQQHELYLLDSINDKWYAGQLFTTPEAR
jgi:hypothetical protein